jgi:photosystem II stability/assembly factor-like uncharacterized protein
MRSLFYPPLCVYDQTVAIGGDALAVTRTGGPPWATVSLGLDPNDVVTASCIGDSSTIYVATMAGRVLRLNWNGAAWLKAALTSPFSAYISCIALDPVNAQRIWVASSEIAAGAMVCRSDNGGTAWVDCTIGLPGIPKNAIAIDPADNNRVWIGADVGVYASTNAGGTWAPFSRGLPNAMAVDLVLHQRDRKLYCATRNRGVWVAPI